MAQRLKKRSSALAPTILVIAVLATLALPSAVRAEETDLTELSLEELFDVVVTTASRQKESLTEAPASTCRTPGPPLV